MILENKINKEEKLINKLLFSDQKLNKSSFVKCDIDKFVRYTSSHLILPAIYYNIKSKGIEKYIPKDLKIYLKEIFSINRERNKIMIEEVNELSCFLNSKNINHVFLKGSACIIYEIYDDIGERMVGDIDILVKQKDVEYARKQLNKFGYISKEKFNHLRKYHRHLGRMTKKDKVFAVEIHKKLFKQNIINVSESELFKSSVKKRGIKVPSIENLIANNIYNFQINDFGGIFLKFSYKSYYEIFKIIQKFDLKKLNNLNADYEIKKYFITANEMKVPKLNSFLHTKSIMTRIRFNLKRKFITFRFFDNLLCNEIIKFRLRKIIAVEFLKNKNYRKMIIKRILSN